MAASTEATARAALSQLDRLTWRQRLGHQLEWDQTLT